MEIKRKTPVQLQALEGFYSEERYPKQYVMEGYARALGLTYKQVRGWFIERRRKDKREVGPTKEQSAAAASSSSILRNKLLGLVKKKERRNRNGVCRRHGVKTVKKPFPLQDMLWTPDYILKTIFRKDGPPLGLEFDSLPSRAFCNCPVSPLDSQENRSVAKRRKVLQPNILDCRDCTKKSSPIKKHGVGKGFMTVWRETNHGAVDFSTSVGFTGIEPTSVLQFSASVSKKPPREKKARKPNVKKPERPKSKVQNKRKNPLKRKEVVSEHPDRTICELALGGVVSEEDLNQFALLEDDEELELRELREGTYPPTCFAHLAADGLHGCSLCKDLLVKFPPTNVKMKQVLVTQPWGSSPEMVKKMFKIFHVVYTYAAVIDVSPFTLDELAQALHDKDSFLLGEVHVALLRFLLSNIEMELCNGFLPRLSTSCKFLGLLQSVQDQEYVVEFWKKSLNPLTWTEIMRQVLVAAGYGFKHGTLQREAPSKEVSRMTKYGLRSGTLKGELFGILSERGNNGMKVSELAKSLQIGKLNLASTVDELEALISSTLSSDITLFEKISSSTYRLRISFMEETDNCQLGTDDSGSVDNDSEEIGTCSSDDNSEYDSDNSSLNKIKSTNECKRKNLKLAVYTEIDESHAGEIWLLGLMEGEYADLSVEEKLNALVALVDLVSAGSSSREENEKEQAEVISRTRQYGSGGKIKRSSAMESILPRPSSSHVGSVHQTCKPSEFHQLDSSSSISKLNLNEYSSSKRNGSVENGGQKDIHPMQSVFLGSDRRYNRYWLFLGPCNDNDPGHYRIYFESSEDGHWEVIDTEEALCALLSVLDDKGRREAALIASLRRREAFLCQSMSKRVENCSGIRNSTHSDQSDLDIIRDDGSSPVSGVDNQSLSEIGNDSLASAGSIFCQRRKKEEDQKQKWSRLQAFDAWIWNSFYAGLNAVKHSKRSYLDSLARCESCHDLYWRDEKHCKICHATFELDFDLEEKYAVHAATCREKEEMDICSKLLPSQLQSLKAAVHVIESVMPGDALIGSWTKSAHKLWVKRLRRTSSLAELLQVLTDFVGAINEDWLCQCNVVPGSNTILEEILTNFPPLPMTSSAVALWVVKLDILIGPYLERVSIKKIHERSTKAQGKLAIK